MTLSSELRPLLQKVMVVYTVYMKGLNRVRRKATVTLFSLHYISEEIVSLMTLSSELATPSESDGCLHCIHEGG